MKKRSGFLRPRRTRLLLTRNDESFPRTRLMDRCCFRRQPRRQRVPLLMVITSIGLLGLCSCAMPSIWFSHDSVPPELPAAVSFNPGAGRGDLLYLTLRLETGEELLFLLDTGAAFTLLDKSLEQGLG